MDLPNFDSYYIPHQPRPYRGAAPKLKNLNLRDDIGFHAAAAHASLMESYKRNAEERDVEHAREELFDAWQRAYASGNKAAEAAAWAALTAHQIAIARKAA
jgi:hypothetical protein